MVSGAYLGRRAHAGPALEPQAQGRALGVLPGLEEPEEDVLLVGCVLGTGGEADIAGI